MLIKTLLFFLFTLSFVYANESVAKFFAPNIITHQKKFTANGQIELYYQDSVFKADKIYYDQNRSYMKFSGNVEVQKGINDYIKSDLIELFLKNKDYVIDGLYFQNKPSELWIVSSKTKITNSNYVEFDSSSLSSCNPQNPDWEIEFTSGDYNTESKWLNLYNARLYFFDVPIIYLPYVGIPLDKTRKSGLLTPKFGLSEAEGFFYKQPIYLAPSVDFDMTIEPQVRTNRGRGVYTNFRYANTPNSILEMNMGYFKENDDYATTYDLFHKEHFGLDLDYEQRFKTLLFEQGLYADINLISDVDYYALNTDDELTYPNLIPSYINYVANSDSFYGGVYSRYYIDTQSEHNTQTLQVLPELHFHNYLKEIYKSDFLYSIDYSLQNHFRVEGLEAKESTLNIPVIYSKSFLDGYLNFSFDEQIYGKWMSLSQQPQRLENESNYYIKTKHILNINTDLMKVYDNTVHSMLVSLSYEKDGENRYNGLYKDYQSSSYDCSEDGVCEFIIDTNQPEVINFGITNYLSDKMGKEILYHNLTQSYLLESEDNKLSELENDIQWRFLPNYSLYNNLKYSHETNKVTKSSTTLSYDGSLFKVNLNHLYEDGLRIANYFNTTINYKYNDKYNYYMNYQYDYLEKVAKNYRLGVNMKKRCRSYNISVSNLRRPIIQNDGTSYVSDLQFMFHFGFNPIGSFNYSYLKKNKEGE